jgi:hypothetical protein
MAYREYRCRDCGKTVFFFEEEVNIETINMAVDHEYEPMPHNPFIIHQTDCFMAEAIIDSLDTANELDRILTREVRHQKEDKLVQDARRNL